MQITHKARSTVIHSINLIFTLRTIDKNLHAYIQAYVISHYNPSDLASHTTYVAFVNFLHKWWDLLFKVDAKRQIFGKVFMIISNYFHNFCQKSSARKLPKNYFCIFWATNDLLDYGDNAKIVLDPSRQTKFLLINYNKNMTLASNYPRIIECYKQPFDRTL